jgi:hypothetical protein
MLNHTLAFFIEGIRELLGLFEIHPLEQAYFAGRFTRRAFNQTASITGHTLSMSVAKSVTVAVGAFCLPGSITRFTLHLCSSFTFFEIMRSTRMGIKSCESSQEYHSIFFLEKAKPI